jgi:hypothetical protein
MIAIDHNQTIGLMQSPEKIPLTSSFVNHHHPLSNITDSNPCIYHQKKVLSSSRVCQTLKNKTVNIE